jgi:hypothetical protein
LTEGCMPKLVFHSNVSNASVAIAGTLAITVGDGKLSAGGPAIASHSGGVWRIGDVALSRISCEGPVHLEIHTATGPRRFGPLADLVIDSNAIWSAGAVFAGYSALSRAWHVETKGKAESLTLPLDIGLVPV